MHRGRFLTDAIRVSFRCFALGLWLILTGCDAAPPLPDNAPAELKKWHNLAKQGDVEAQYAIGLAYIVGTGIKKDSQTARYWITKAADQGHAPAQYQLGSYYTLPGLDQDSGRAFEWLLKSARQGNAEAQLSVAMFYFLGSADNRVEAYAWVELARQNGVEDAVLHEKILRSMDIDTFAKAKQRYYALTKELPP